MNLIISLKDFALSGEFGPVKVGMHRDEAVAFLGEPTFEGDLDSGYSTFNYHWYEFFYETESKEVSSIQNDSLEHLSEEQLTCKGLNFTIDPWFISPQKVLTLTEVKTLLIKEGVEYQIKTVYELVKIVLNSGVILDFDNRENIKEKSHLIGISYSPIR